MDQALNSQKTPHTSPLRASYGMSFVSILMKNDRVIKGFYCMSVRQLPLDSEKEYSNAPHYWPFVSGIHRGPVDSLHKNISIAQRICMYVLLEHLTFNDVFARNTDRVLTTSKERLQHCSHIGDDTNKHITHLSLNLTHGRHFSDDILV